MEAMTGVIPGTITMTRTEATSTNVGRGGFT